MRVHCSRSDEGVEDTGEGCHKWGKKVLRKEGGIAMVHIS